VLSDLGLPGGLEDRPLERLSGGQQVKVNLAAVLLSRFDVLLLDEPTNNLDFAGLDLLERFLVGVTGAVVVVSHDRAFLDHTVTRIVEITEHEHRAVSYAGGWSDYVAARELARSQQYEAFSKYQSEKQRLTERMRSQRSWSVQGVNRTKKNPKDNDKAQRGFFTNRTEKQASKVRATEKRLTQLEVVDKPWEGWNLKLELTPTKRSGDVVARLFRAVVRRGSFTLGPVDLEVAWQERLAILGPNGSGKSTLIGALLGSLPLDEGERWLGPSVRVGEMDQARVAFEGDASVLAAVQRRTGLPLPEARSLLAKFGLGPDHVDRPGARLSPGERTRAILATLMAEGVNCLVLDEPTNHLDLEAIEQLEQALQSFEGTLVLVTHDRRLLETVSLTRTFELA
jgi:ATPase subunit of ABC transporter with duplicated ATPase domains